jgi:hypothetical protein
MITIFHPFFLPRDILLESERLNLMSSLNTQLQVVLHTIHLEFSPFAYYTYVWNLPSLGVVLRPGFIYGKRKVDGFEIPLDIVGQPLEKLLSSVENFTKPLSSLPASDLILAPPVSVDDVAYAVINAVIDDRYFGVFTIEQIKEAAAKVRV